MTKTLSALASARMDECYNNLQKMTDRNMLEAIRAHFESHPALPNEKVLRENAGEILKTLNLQAPEDEWFDGWSKFVEAGISRQSVIQDFAQTRIRETSLNEDFRQVDVASLVHNAVNDLDIPNVNIHQYVAKQSHYNEDVYIGRIEAMLVKEDDEVRVFARHTAGGFMDIGSLPEKFLKNNPMIVASCPAEIEFADFSNKQFKNLSGRIVVDTDMMTGDDVEELEIETFEGEDELDDDFAYAVDSISDDNGINLLNG